MSDSDRRFPMLEAKAYVHFLRRVAHVNGWHYDQLDDRLLAVEAELAAARAENERLREACRWYALEAHAISQNTATNNVDAITASMTVLSLDAGNRYAAALSPVPLEGNKDAE